MTCSNVNAINLLILVILLLVYNHTCITFALITFVLTTFDPATPAVFTFSLMFILAKSESVNWH